MMPGEERAAVPVPDVIDRYIAAYNETDIAGMLACLTDDIRFENRADGRITAAAAGKADFEALARRGAAAFVARRQTIMQAITVADTTVLAIAFAATVAVDLPNGWRAGHRVALSGTALFRLREGLIDRIVDESRPPSCGEQHDRERGDSA